MNGSKTDRELLIDILKRNVPALHDELNRGVSYDKIYARHTVEMVAEIENTSRLDSCFSYEMVLLINHILKGK